MKIVSGGPKVFIFRDGKEAEIECPVVAELLLGIGRKRFGLPFPLEADGKARTLEIDDEYPRGNKVTVTTDKNTVSVLYKGRELQAFVITKVREPMSRRIGGDAEIKDTVKYNLVCKCNLVVELSRVGKNVSMHRTMTVVDFNVSP